MDDSLGWSTTNKIAIAVSFFLTMVFTGYMTYLKYPIGIYEAVSSCLIVTLILYWKHRKDSQLYLFLCSALFYSLFWAIRDSIFGFYNQQTWWESAIALFPTVLILIHLRAPDLKCSRKWYEYLIATVIHLSLCYIFQDTDNELLAILTLLVLSDRWSFGSRFVLYSFFWYQAYLGSTRYMLPQYINLDIIYFVGLTPYIASLVFLIIKKATNANG
jgi:hypothetical protein